MNQGTKWNWKMFLTLKTIQKTFIIACCLGIVLIIINMADRIKQSLSLQVMDGEFKDNVWMEMMALKMESRRLRLEKSCRITKLNIRGNDSLHKPNEWEFLISWPHRLVWCNVFKAASTSWMHNFSILAGYTEQFLQIVNEVPLQLTRSLYPRPKLETLEKALNRSLSFLIVRHPFERLLSAYRDKIEYGIPHSYHYNLGNYIIMSYRESVKPRMNKACIFKFDTKSPRRPTFSEFVQFLTNFSTTGQQMDEHWAPITNFCTPCQVRFDVIMKLESFEEDQKYLIKRLNLEKWIKPQWKNPTKHKKNLPDLINKYYKELTSTQIYQLYNIYRNDFYLFEYKIDDYKMFLDPIHADLISRDLKRFF